MPPPKSSASDNSSEQLRQELEALNQALHRKPKAPGYQPRYLNSTVSSSNNSNTSKKDSSVGRSFFTRSNTSKSASHDPHKTNKDGAFRLSQDRSSSSKITRPQDRNIKVRPTEQAAAKPQAKKGFWNWGPFRSISSSAPQPPTQQRFHVLFSLHVHRIEGLPATMNGLRLTVHWKRKEEGLQTMPSRVLRGEVEFDETLRQRCTVDGTRNNNRIKYDPKLFTVSVVALDVDGLDLGYNHIDLSRLLPEDDSADANAYQSKGWNTSFDLSGAGKGSALIVTFNYDLLHQESSEDDHVSAVSEQSVQPALTVKNDSLKSINGSNQVLVIANTAVHSEPGLVMEHANEGENACANTALDSEPVSKYREDKLPPAVDDNGDMSTITQNNMNDQDACIGEQHLGITSVQNTGSVNIIDESTKQINITHQSTERMNSIHQSTERINIIHQSTERMNIIHQSTKTEQSFGETMKSEELDFDAKENVKYNDKTCDEDTKPSVVDSQKEPEILDDTGILHDIQDDFDDEVDLVAGEFLNMLDIGFGSGLPNSEGESDSPRAKLLKQFEQESLFGVGLDFPDTDTQKSNMLTTIPRVRDYREEFNPDLDSDDASQLASIMEAAEVELQKAAQAERSKVRAKALEDEETQALMKQWGLSEDSFQNSPPKPVGNVALGPYLPRPPLGNGLGPVLNLKDGGSLRSMSPAHFPKNKSKAGLVMQSSKPVVVPSSMGSSAVDILRHLASFGTENLARQAMAAMPLEDVSGMVAEDIASMAANGADASNNGSYMYADRHQDDSFLRSQSGLEDLSRNTVPKADRFNDGGYDDYVSLEDLAPLAMQNIESLAIDGLKIQADMADEEAPSYLDAAAWGVLEDSKKREKDHIGSSEGVAGMHFKSLQSVEDMPIDEKHDGPLSMAITLEEWTKLDAGVVENDEKSKEKTLAILAAHNAKHRDWGELMNRDDNNKKPHAKKGGMMGNTLMIAVLVQLRDPFNNFEPVGAPMMALIQAERVMVPPKPRIGRRVSIRANNELQDDEAEAETKIIKKEEAPKIIKKEEAPQFKLTGVHMSGLKTNTVDELKPAKGTEIQKKTWGNQKQVQSGSKWLVAQGMGKSSKPSFLKSKASPSPSSQTNVKPGETLWSISARVHGSGSKWRELAALNPHIRNPDVIFSNETIRTR